MRAVRDPDLSDSQADSAGSIPVTRSHVKAQARLIFRRAPYAGARPTCDLPQGLKARFGACTTRGPACLAPSMRQSDTPGSARIRLCWPSFKMTSMVSKTVILDRSVLGPEAELSDQLMSDDRHTPTHTSGR